MATPSNLVKCIAGSIIFELIGLSKLLITDYKRSAKRVKHCCYTYKKTTYNFYFIFLTTTEHDFV